MMFKKRNVKNSRKSRIRKESKESDSESENIEIVKNERTKRHENPNVQSSKKIYAAGSDDEDDYRKMINLKYKSTMTTESNLDRSKIATGGENPDMGPEMDIQATTRRDDEIQKALQAGSLDDNIYRGQGGYRKYHKIRSEAHTKASLSVKGPVRGNSFFRASIRIDHEPCICKDYKETGFCGFGDSCKFIHDRSDYKMGWQIEREMNEGTYTKTEEENWEVSDEEEDLPFKCIICRDNFKRPVVTRCGHYFCEDCAIGHYKKSKRCFVCNKQTNGIFNMAKNIVAKLKGIKERDVKNSDWDNRLIAPADSDEEENEEELTAEEKEEQIELEKLRLHEAEEKAKKLADIKAGKIIADSTIQPMSDPESSSNDEEGAPLLGEYEPEDLSNNIGKKQKEKSIKNTVPDHLNKPQFSDSSDSGDDSGEIHDPTLYDPRDLVQLDQYSQSTNPELTTNAMELTQNRMNQQKLLAEKRQAQDELDAIPKQEPVKQEPDERIKTEPDCDEPLISRNSMVTNNDVKTDPDFPTLQQSMKKSNPINVLNPIAGAIHVPKPSQPRHSKNKLVQNIQSHARSQVPDKSSKSKKDKNIVRSFLPNMNPYSHRDKNKPEEESHNDKAPSTEIPKSLAPLPEDNKRKGTEIENEIQFKKKKKQTPQDDQEWDDLPQDIMEIKSVSNKKMDWKQNSKQVSL